jgi:hypothetical protein
MKYSVGELNVLFLEIFTINSKQFFSYKLSVIKSLSSLSKIVSSKILLRFSNLLSPNTYFMITLFESGLPPNIIYRKLK